MNILGILILSVCVGLGSSQANNTTISLTCYSCNPSANASQCADPIASKAPLVNCSDTNTIGCYSTYLIYTNAATGNNTNTTTKGSGIYRGCVTSSDNDCVLFSGIDVTFKTYATCSDSKCNTQRFNKDGGVSGGASTIFPSIFVIMISGICMHHKLF